MLRLVFVAVFLILFLVLGIPVLCVEWLVARRFSHAADLSQLRIVQWGFKCILGLSGVRLTVVGEEHVPKDTAVLYIGNHRSFFDIVITYSRCPGLTGYVAKDSMLKVPLLSVWMKRLHCLFLNRTDVKEGLKTILTGIDQIKRGISVCIFPEGTRTKGTDETELLPFKEGSMKMATKTGCPVIPMAITGSADIFENHFPWIRAADVRLEYGEPIYPEQLSKDELKHLGEYTRGVVLQMLRNAR